MQVVCQPRYDGHLVWFQMGIQVGIQMGNLSRNSNGKLKREFKWKFKLTVFGHVINQNVVDELL